MHYIRFLKPPFLSQPFKSSKDVQVTTKITITSDLGESFLCVDLPVQVILLDNNGVHFQPRPFLWKAGNRQLEMSFSISRSALGANKAFKGPFRVLVQPQTVQNRLEKLACLLMDLKDYEDSSALVAPILSEPLSELDPATTSRRVQRLFRMANGEPLYIWEETGESIARHIWYVMISLYMLPDVIY
jgi:hypothetical protein